MSAATAEDTVQFSEDTTNCLRLRPRIRWNSARIRQSVCGYGRGYVRIRSQRRNTCQCICLSGGEPVSLHQLGPCRPRPWCILRADSEVIHGDGLRTLHDAAQGVTEGPPQIPCLRPASLAFLLDDRSTHLQKIPVMVPYPCGVQVHVLEGVLRGHQIVLIRSTPAVRLGPRLFCADRLHTASRGARQRKTWWTHERLGL